MHFPFPHVESFALTEISVIDEGSRDAQKELYGRVNFFLRNACHSLMTDWRGNIDICTGRAY
jgi:hypothetical protein